jgi:hypothetical protein
LCLCSRRLKYQSRRLPRRLLTASTTASLTALWRSSLRLEPRAAALSAKGKAPRRKRPRAPCALFSSTEITVSSFASAPTGCLGFGLVDGLTVQLASARASRTLALREGQSFPEKETSRALRLSFCRLKQQSRRCLGAYRRPAPTDCLDVGLVDGLTAQLASARASSSLALREGQSFPEKETSRALLPAALAPSRACLRWPFGSSPSSIRQGQVRSVKAKSDPSRPSSIRQG